MKKKVIGSILVVSCLLPTTSVMATEIEIEEEDTIIVGGSVILNFNSDCGTECPSMVLPVASTPTTYELPVPMKAGHTFKGWFTEDGTQITGENPFKAFDSVLTGETATVKAKWEKQESVTATSSLSTEEIKDSEEYYELIQKTENFADGSKIVTNKRTKKIEGYVIEEEATYTYYNQDGSTTQEGMTTYYGYGEYQRAKAKNDLSVTVVDVNGNPVEGFEINFKTTEEDINLKTDKDGKITHTFKPGTYESKVVTVPSGYALNHPGEKLGLGKMYSISYVEKYVLDIVEINEPPKKEDKTDVTIIEEKIDENKDKNENKDETTIIVQPTNKDKDKNKTETKKPSNQNTSSSVTANINDNSVKENPDPNNKDVVKAPQTDDNTSFLFLGLIPISFAFMLKKKKR